MLQVGDLKCPKGLSSGYFEVELSWTTGQIFLHPVVSCSWQKKLIICVICCWTLRRLVMSCHVNSRMQQNFSALSLCGCGCGLRSAFRYENGFKWICVHLVSQCVSVRLLWRCPIVSEVIRWVFTYLHWALRNAVCLHCRWYRVWYRFVWTSCGRGSNKQVWLWPQISSLWFDVINEYSVFNFITGII